MTGFEPASYTLLFYPLNYPEMNRKEDSNLQLQLGGYSDQIKQYVLTNQPTLWRHTETHIRSITSQKIPVSLLRFELRPPVSQDRLAINALPYFTSPRGISVLPQTLFIPMRDGHDIIQANTRNRSTFTAALPFMLKRYFNQRTEQRFSSTTQSFCAV